MSVSKGNEILCIYFCMNARHFSNSNNQDLSHIRGKETVLVSCWVAFTVSLPVLLLVKRRARNVIGFL